MLYVRSASDDRNARAVIRDEALRLSAERGPDAMTVRQIATAIAVIAAAVALYTAVVMLAFWRPGATSPWAWPGRPPSPPAA
jgi:hypothetical protein